MPTWQLIAGSVCSLVVLAFIGMILHHNWRVRRIQRVACQIPDDVRRDVLDLIRKAAISGPQVTFWRRGASADETPPDWIDQSHLGGVPYAKPDESWPVADAPDDDPPPFLMQLRLVGDGLGDVWRDRIVTVFLQFSDELIVRSYPADGNFAPLDSPQRPLRFAKLQATPMPLAEPEDPEDDSAYPAPPNQLLSMIPEIEAALAPFTRDVAGALTQILRPDHYGYSLDTCDIAYEGGQPGLIQNEHDALCLVCDAPMRFLFQFGEMFEDLQLADGGVVYVYGCDAHPECCRAFIDSC